MFKSMGSSNKYHLTFLLFPNFHLSELSNILECLRAANEYAEEDIYSWGFASRDGKATHSNVGIDIPCALSFAEIKSPDNVLLLSDGYTYEYRDDLAYGFLRRWSRDGAHIGAVGGATSLLVSSGIAGNYKTATHWSNLPALKEERPEAVIEACMYAVDGKRFSCGGGTTVIDMVLSEIQDKLGVKIADAIARDIVHERVRAGEEKQNILTGQKLGTKNQKLIRTVEFMEEYIETPLTLEELGAKVGSCRRQLERIFLKDLDVTPARFYMELRLERAHNLIIQSSLSILEVALACGFKSGSHFSRVYRRFYGFTPYSSRRYEKQEYAA